MNKKGVVWKHLIEGILVFLVVVFVISGVYHGLVGDVIDIAESGLPTKEKFQNILKRITTTSGALALEEQKGQANEIMRAIFDAISKMRSDNDCIEEIDFSNVIDKDFIVEFRESEKEGFEIKIDIYKIINQQKSFIFGSNLRFPIYYFSDDARHKDRYFKIIDGLRKIEYGKEKIVWFLYKNKRDEIGFLSKDDFNKGFKYKQICSRGGYVERIIKKELEKYKKVIISESRYSKDNLGLDRTSFNTYVIGPIQLWYYESDTKLPGFYQFAHENFYVDATSFSYGEMVDIINYGMDSKFKIELIYLSSDFLEKQGCEKIISVEERYSPIPPKIVYITYLDKNGKIYGVGFPCGFEFECGSLTIDTGVYCDGRLSYGEFNIDDYMRL